MRTDVMQRLRWLRVPGDTILALGAVALVWFVAGLKMGHSLEKGTDKTLPAL
jgi:nitric oxide reductase subunit B